MMLMELFPDAIIVIKEAAESSKRAPEESCVFSSTFTVMSAPQMLAQMSGIDVNNRLLQSLCWLHFLLT